MPDEYNPNSVTATLARLIERQEAMKDLLIERANRHDETLARIEEQATKTNGRVTRLERERDITKAKVAGIAVTLGAVGSLIGWAFSVLIG